MTRIQFVTASTGNNATQASYTGAWYNAFDITFTITMLPSKQLQFLVTFADAVHLQVVLDRVGDSKPIAAPAVGPDGVIVGACTVAPSPCVFYVCLTCCWRQIAFTGV